MDLIAVLMPTSIEANRDDRRTAVAAVPSEKRARRQDGRERLVSPFVKPIPLIRRRGGRKRGRRGRGGGYGARWTKDGRGRKRTDALPVLTTTLALTASTVVAKPTKPRPSEHANAPHKRCGRMGWWVDGTESRSCQDCGGSTSSSWKVHISGIARAGASGSRLQSDESEVVSTRGRETPPWSAPGRRKGTSARGPRRVSFVLSRSLVSFCRCRFKTGMPSSTALSEKVLGLQASANSC